MAKMSVSEARERLAEAVETSQTEADILERCRHPAVILVSPDHYELMMDALKEIQDIASYDESMSEEGPNIPWDLVKSDLGWN